MARAYRPIRFLLAVAAGAVLLLAVLALIGNLYFARVPHVGAARRDAPAPSKSQQQPQPRARPIDAPALRPPPDEPEPDFPKIAGPTRFVRRLEAGTHLQALADELKRGTTADSRIHAGFLALLPHLLAVDNLPSQDFKEALGQLTKPRRDRDAFQLCEGPAGRLRVWTIGSAMDAQVVNRAGELLAQLIAVAGHPMPEGVDVLCTPSMGSDVFPGQPSVAWASGVYVHPDGYCAVRSAIAPREREATMRHELVHAYTLGPAGQRAAPRFVSEGMAEYLRFLCPRDGGVHIPPRAMRNELAFFLTAIEHMERMGIDMTDVQPRDVVNLKPWDFYALPFGYAAALAMHAYVGGGPIEEALRAKSPEPLREALCGIEWAAFREWLQTEANGGNAQEAYFASDRETNGDDPENESAGWRVLQSIGAKLPRGVRATTNESIEAMGTTEQIDAVLRTLIAPGRGVLLATDLSKSMDAPLAEVAIPAAAQPADAPPFEAATRRDLVASLHERLRRADGSVPVLIGITARLEVRENVDAVVAYTLDALPGWLDLRNEPTTRLVVCTAQELSGRSADRLLKLVRRIPADAAVLIVDLCPGTASDGAFLARSLAYRGSALHVAYWRP